MIFPLEDGCFERTLAISRECKVANLYAVFLNVDEITRHLYEIQTHIHSNKCNHR